MIKLFQVHIRIKVNVCILNGNIVNSSICDDDNDDNDTNDTNCPSVSVEMWLGAWNLELKSLSFTTHFGTY